MESPETTDGPPVTVQQLLNVLNTLPPAARCLPVVFWEETGEYRLVRRVRLCQREGAREVHGPEAGSVDIAEAVIGLFSR